MIQRRYENLACSASTFTFGRLRAFQTAFQVHVVHVLDGLRGVQDTQDWQDRYDRLLERFPMLSEAQVLQKLRAHQGGPSVSDIQ